MVTKEGGFQKNMIAMKNGCYEEWLLKKMVAKENGC